MNNKTGLTLFISPNNIFFKKANDKEKAKPFPT